jgi:hypothetical protein
MIRSIFLFELIMISAIMIFSTYISGRVLDKYGKGIADLNSYIQNTCNDLNSI